MLFKNITKIILQTVIVFTLFIDAFPQPSQNDITQTRYTGIDSSHGAIWESLLEAGFACDSLFSVGAKCQIPVYFNFDMETLLPDSYIVIDTLAICLLPAKNMTFEIGVHSDDELNKMISARYDIRRANHIMEYLIIKGVNNELLTANGYMGSQPIISDSVIQTMSSEDEKKNAYSLNSRIELRIVAVRENNKNWLNPTLDYYHYSDTLVKDSFGRYYILNKLQGYKDLMLDLKEPSMEIVHKQHQYLFRILSLPSFDPAICFTISKKDQNHYLHWTVGRGAAGYEFKGIKKKGKKKITIDDWAYMKTLSNISMLDTLPVASYFPSNDGTSWAIEKNIQSQSDIYFTNEVPVNFQRGFDMMLHISGIKSSETIFYSDEPALNYFDKNNQKIDLKEIDELISEHLENKLFNLSDPEKFCKKCDFFVKINKRGKVVSVKYLPYMLPYYRLEDWYDEFSENIIDRKLLKEVRKSLKSLEFTNLNLNKSLWVPVYKVANDYESKQ